MKILRKGNLDLKHNWIVGLKDLCFDCSTEVQFEERDTFISTYSSVNDFLVWLCPVCHRRNLKIKPII